MKNININNQIIAIKDDYISLTDMARLKDKKDPKKVIQNWMRNRLVVLFLGLWEKINNSSFKGLEFEAFKKAPGLSKFSLSPEKWIKSTKSIGIISSSGRYGGGTFAHKDIAFEFASWLSPEFKLYLITEFQRLKNEESEVKNLDWNVKRALTKINYKIHNDTVKTLK